MIQRAPDLPEFSSPPVVEVALGVQFQRLALRSVHVGLLWNRFKDRFPRSEEHPLLAAAVEEFGPGVRQKSAVRVELVEGPLPQRHWFVNEAGTKLIQVQQDRFVHNWRKGHDDYPRYGSIRDTFEQEFGIFQEFVEAERLGPLRPNQCEVAYVNHISAGIPSEPHVDPGTLLTVWTSQYSDGFLPQVEDTHLLASYAIPGSGGLPIGRLHVELTPAYGEDKQPLYQLRLTARTSLGEASNMDVRGALDLGHEWIVRGFASITSRAMHQIWGRVR